MDHSGSDLTCTNGTDAGAAKAECDSSPNCQAFNLVVDRRSRRCTKRFAAPLAKAPGVCFYTKQNQQQQGVLLQEVVLSDPYCELS